MRKTDFLDSLAAFAFGLYFALIQFTYFFLLEAFLSSRALPFFISLFFWLIGFLTGLNLKKTGMLLPLLGAGGTAYYGALFLVRMFPFQYGLLPVMGLLIGVSGLLPGYFFPYARERFAQVKYLFFHENNGFILGIILSLFAAVFAGKWMLAFAPLAGALPVLGALLLQRLFRRS